MKKTINIAIATLVAAGASQAALITGVTVESFSGQNGGFNRLASYTIDQSGFTPTTPGEVGGTHGNSPGGTMWMESNGDKTTGSIVYDLGAIYNVDKFRVWNYNENGLSNRSMNRVEVTYGETVALGNTIASITNFAQSPGANGYTGEEFTFATVSARYFRIESFSNYGGSETGLSEIQFNEADPVAIPEPTSTALLGLGALALIMRRRK